MASNFDSSLATKLVAPPVSRLRSLSYAEIKEKVVRGDIDTGDIKAPDGVLYQFELLFYRDDLPDKDLRVIASIFIDPRGPYVSDSFIKVPDNRFVEEGNAN